MLKFCIVVLLILAASFVFSFLATEQEKVYKAPAERKNTEIYPFYELWGYVGAVVAVILVISTVADRLKNNVRI